MTQAVAPQAHQHRRRQRHRWLKALAIIGAASFTVSGSPLMAEEDPLVLDLFRPQLDVGLESTPRKTFTDDEDVVLPNGITNLNDEEFGRETLFLNTNIPLGGTHLRPEGSIVGYQFFASAQFASSSTDITFLSRNPDLYNCGLRFTAVMLGKGLKIYVASVGASFAEDQDTIGDMKPRFSGLGLGTHRKSEETTFVYGEA